MKRMKPKLVLGGWCFSGAWILVLGVFLLSGCLSRKPLTKESFAFTIPESSRVAAQPNAPTLTVRQVTVAAPFDSSSLTYRTGQFSFERDPYAGFLVTPAGTLAPAIRARLENTGKFSSVTDPDSSLRGTLDLEIAVTEMYGDFRNKSQPAAVLVMRFVLFHPTQGFRSANKSKSSVMLQKTYRQRVPLKARTANAVVEGLNEALDQIVKQFASDAAVP
jgi:cholesterol transport system auxiliary component